MDMDNQSECSGIYRDDLMKVDLRDIMEPNIDAILLSHMRTLIMLITYHSYMKEPQYT
jgi:hypothetical protein